MEELPIGRFLTTAVLADTQATLWHLWSLTADARISRSATAALDDPQIPTPLDRLHLDEVSDMPDGTTAATALSHGVLVLSGEPEIRPSEIQTTWLSTAEENRPEHMPHTRKVPCLSILA